MRFKGTIVITDPCYLDHGMDQDLWEASDYGEDLSVFGCSQWICRDTIYGDWSCTTYQTNPDKFAEFLKKANDLYSKLDNCKPTDLNFETIKEFIYDQVDKLSEKYGEMPVLGRFCADAGMVCVVYLDEIIKVNPHFEEFIKEHSWCVTVIKDFDGEVEYEIDDNDEAHIAGRGNIEFYTTQTGL